MADKPLRVSSVPEKPTVLIVQGSFQNPSAYEGLINGLTKLGYPTILPQLPSCGNSTAPSFPSIDLIDDALAIQAKLEDLIDYQHKTVTVAMHSYGGLVGSEAISCSFAFSRRQSQGLKGGVIQLFFFTAFLLSEGESLLSVFGESANNGVNLVGCCLTIRSGAQVLYNDLLRPEAEIWESRSIPQSSAVRKTKVTRAAWRYIPSTYLICENDQVAPVEYQEICAKKAGARVERCSSGHSPMLSRTDMLVGKIGEAVRRSLEVVDKEKPGNEVVNTRWEAWGGTF